jgi:hypothetical protein
MIAKEEPTAKGEERNPKQKIERLPVLDMLLGDKLGLLLEGVKG